MAVLIMVLCTDEANVDKKKEFFIHQFFSLCTRKSCSSQLKVFRFPGDVAMAHPPHRGGGLMDPLRDGGDRPRHRGSFREVRINVESEIDSLGNK